mgnify:FL=1
MPGDKATFPDHIQTSLPLTLMTSFRHLLFCLVAAFQLAFCVQAAPDLAVFDWELNTQTPIRGDTVTLKVKVGNLDSSSIAGSSFVVFFFGNKAISDAFVPALVPLDSEWVEISFTIEPGIVSGTYDLTILLDGYGQVAESSESNNLRTWEIEVQPQSNLTLEVEESALASSLVPFGGTVSATATIVNNGEVPTSATSTIAYYWKKDLPLSYTEPYRVDTQAIASLAKDATQVSLLSLPIDEDAIGYYHLYLDLDPSQSIAELDEDDNTFAWEVAVYDPENPVLIAKPESLTFSNQVEVEVSASATEGQTVELRNFGGTAMTLTSTSLSSEASYVSVSGELPMVLEPFETGTLTIAVDLTAASTGTTENSVVLHVIGNNQTTTIPVTIIKESKPIVHVLSFKGKLLADGKEKVTGTGYLVQDASSERQACLFRLFPEEVLGIDTQVIDLTGENGVFRLLSDGKKEYEVMAISNLLSGEPLFQLTLNWAIKTGQTLTDGLVVDTASSLKGTMSILLPAPTYAHPAARATIRPRAPESAVPATLERTAARTAPNAINAE